MDEFFNTLDRNAFESTNGLWNELMLNDPWSVGYVTTLIEMKTFNTKEDWEEFYYETGNNRDVAISRLPEGIQSKLNDEQLVKRNRNELYEMDWDLKNLNYNYGRTKKQIEKKGAILFQNAGRMGLTVTEKECAEAVRYRTICQTWNGVIIRERNTVRALKTKFPDVNFVSTTGDFDHKYAVDYELQLDEIVICGIQIKPKSYLGKAPYLRKAQNANSRKNQAYIDEFGKPVYNVISTTNGNIINQDVETKILNLLK